MATYTSNLNLYMPDSTDDFGEFREEHNDNMVKIDNAIGGGGGSGGHTIVNESGTDMPAEGKLQFTGGVTVTDDSVNGKTVVDISGGGGNVYGAFIDTNRIITSGSYSLSLSYTATEDCFMHTAVALNNNTGGSCAVDGETVSSWWNGSSGTVAEGIGIYLKRGQTFTATATNSSSSAYTVYGITQGTNGIFTPIIYSDTERVVGVWRDNKPLYQKTFNITPSSSNFNIDVSSLNIETMVSRFGSFTRLTNGVTQQKPIEYRTESANYNSYGISCAVINSDLSISIESYLYTEILNLRVTLQYTKTTDVAGSGNWNTDGVPTVHYSTTEQVIGTWENGKPLYARLINPNVSTPYTVSGDIKYGSFALSNFIADVDMAWIDTGMSYMDISGATRGFISVWYEKDSGNVTVSTLFERTNVPATIAIKYTKTTD